MTKPVSIVFAAAAGAVLFGGVASAQSVRVENAIARVVYIPENRSDVDVEVQNGSANLPPLDIRRSQGVVTINGNISRNTRRVRSLNCQDGRTSQPPSRPGEGAYASVPGMSRVALSDAPLIIIRGPRDANIGTDGAVHGAIGRGANDVRLTSSGCGNWVIANVTGNTDVNIGGSGDIWSGATESLRINIGGSGDVRATTVKDLRIRIGGSGDVNVQRAEGDVSISVAGSGDVEIGDGRINTLQVNIMGSGEVEVGGVVNDVSATVAGSGDVVVHRVTGNVSQRVLGSGKVRVLNRNR
ncbi:MULTISPECIES: GIN domain-containing protein [unclassified Brevundimonas]|uniref:GIN domain-containing protein n=1 Tax=unclassified Brevundimonas TaxID=2622653 RepID=UPI0025C5EAAD|nr:MULTISPECIES: DUF2807 domain-containing protein [unclassified Brevundimonas]